MAVFTCPHCGHRQDVDDKHAGKTATCPKCKSQGTVTPVMPSREDSTQHAKDDTKQVLQSVQGPLGIRCDGWLSSDTHINKRSSLRVEWRTVTDEVLPMNFTQACGLEIHNVASNYPLQLLYKANTNLVCTIERVTAVEVRYLTFNIWGEHVTTLNAVEILDLNVGQRVGFQHKWHLFSENEADSFCASLAFVARVRLADGSLRRADTNFVLREAQRLSETLSVEDLEPESRGKDK